MPPPPPTCPGPEKAAVQPGPSDRSRAIVEKLSNSRLYKDYQEAFREATGLPLAIRPAKAYTNALRHTKKENPFCALVAQTNKSCANCLKMQEDLEAKAGLEPKSLHCFAGLCDSAVPIRVGDELVAPDPAAAIMQSPAPAG